MGGFASSRILEVHGERMVKRTFDPGFRIELHQKDLNLALTGARALGVSLPNTATAQELFNACAAHGGSDWDHSAMVRALETDGRTIEIGAPSLQVSGPPSSDCHERRPDRAGSHVPVCGACSTPPSPRAQPAQLCAAAAPAAAAQGPHLIVIGAGKASAAMARGGRGRIGRAPLTGPRRHALRLRRAAASRIEIVEAAHPVPDAAGLRAAERILELVAGPDGRTISCSA